MSVAVETSVRRRKMRAISSAAEKQTFVPNRFATFVFCLVVAGAPLPFGSRDPITVAGWCALLAVGIAACSLRSLVRGHLLLLAGIGVIVACYVFVLHEQLAEHPWVAMPHPIWGTASDALGQALAPSASIVRSQPYYAIGPALANMLVLILGIIVGADKAHARLGVRVLAWAGAGYAAYGIMSLLIAPTSLLWAEKIAYIGNVTGTFVNRNTAASFFGSCAVLWMLLLFEKIRGRLPKGPIAWKGVLQQIFSDTGGQQDILIRFAMFFVCLAALLMTNSRAGVLLSLFVLVVTFAAYFRRDLPHGGSIFPILLGAGLAALFVLQFLGGNVGQRLDAQGLSDEGRLSVYRSTLRMIADHPWFGTGLGTFAWAFPAYRDGDISLQGVWDLAHSTPLELVAELGIPLAAVVALGWIAALILIALRTLGHRRDALVPMCALSVTIIGLLHSCVDFSLQISGYAIAVFGLLGIGLSQSIAGSNSRDYPKGHQAAVNLLADPTGDTDVSREGLAAHGA